MTAIDPPGAPWAASFTPPRRADEPPSDSRLSARDALHDLAFAGAKAQGMDDDTAERIVEGVMSGYIAELVTKWTEP